MHGQNINLPVYLSAVCPSHFLSTRLQVRPLNGFFTVDSLKDADLRKDVPFGGLNDEFRGPKSPKTPILGAWIGISSQICEKFK